MSLTAFVDEDEVALYRAVSSRDARFDGRFVFAVTSTGIFCRPSCPARTPLSVNVRYFRVPAAAVAAGFRACKRCRPSSVRGSREWDYSNDLAARALRLVGEGAVDEGGVAGLAGSLAVSERHLHRTLVAQVGVGALALARTRRAQTARLLLEQTELSITDIAFASGFASIRQFNDVMQSEFATAPTALRARPELTVADRPADPPRLVLRLSPRPPWNGSQVLRFLTKRAVASVELCDGESYQRLITTASGHVVARLRPTDDCLVVELALPELEALQPAVAAVRRLFDLDADPAAVDDALRRDPAMAPLVQARPGLRVPGAVGAWEMLVRAVVGQQVTVAGAITLIGRIVERAHRQTQKASSLTLRPFPTPTDLLAADLVGLGLTGRRVETLRLAAEAVVNGRLDLGLGTDRERAREHLLAIPGVGTWTADYVAMRGLGDPDAFCASDLEIKRQVEARGMSPDHWRPWRAYGAIHLWTQAAEEKS